MISKRLSIKRNQLNLKLDLTSLKHKNQYQLYQEDLSTGTSTPRSLENSTHYKFFLRDYKKIEKIGEGMYSVIYKVEEKSSGRLLAAKITKSDEDVIIKQSEQEYQVLIKLQSKGIIKVEKIFKDLERGVIVIICELIELPQINFYKTNITIDWLRKILYNLLNTLNYLHKNNYIHRDISSQNLLVSSTGEIKLIDFGQVEQIKEEGNCVVGMQQIAPPEVISDQRMDIWNAGMVVIGVMKGKIVRSKNIKEVVEREKGMWEDEFREVIESMIVEEEGRASAEQLLRMKFFSKIMSQLKQ